MDDALPEPDRLLAELAWLRRLARRLVRDPDAAEDAVQETVLASLTRAPQGLLARRGWLSAVLRNVARQELRARARRERREREAGRARVAPATLDVVAELALHRRLVELVHGLEEPYRTTLVQRFLHERSPREIAAAAGVPVKTVHTRIERGLARLRERLDREAGGDRAAWVAALAPLAGKSAPLSASLAWSTLLLTLMNAKLIGVAAALGALGAALALSLASRSGPDGPRPALPAGTGAARAQVETPARPADPAARSALGAAPEVLRAEDEAAGARSGVPVAGFVCELDGRRVGGVRVVFEERQGEAFARAAGAPAARAALDGSFEMLVPLRAGRLTVDSMAHASVVRPYLDGAPPAEPAVVVVAPRGAYAGRVVDLEGQPIPGARVSVEPAAQVALLAGMAGEPPRVARLPETLAEVLSGTDGAFALPSVGHLPGAGLVARREGFRDARIALPGPAAFDLELVLERARPQGPVVHGLVLDADGLPAVDAQVSAGGDPAHVGAEGRFALELEPWRGDVVLTAVRAGALPAVLELERGEGLDPAAPVVLHLGVAPRSIRGRVVDRAGAPVPGASVWTPDTTYFGRAWTEVGEGSALAGTTAEALAAGSQGGRGARSLLAEADSAGEFLLEGLLEREYALFALDPDSLAVTGPVDVRSGSADCVLVVGGRGARRVAGRVLSEAGQPLAGVRIAVGQERAWQRPDGPSTASWKRSPLRPPPAELALPERVRATTDREGRFEIEALELEGTFLLLSGRDVLLSPRVRLTDVADVERLEIRVPACARFQVVLAGDPGEADAVARIAGDRPLPLFVRVEELLLSTPRVELVAGRSEVIETGAGPCTLVLLQGTREVRRVDVELAPGELLVVRP